MDNETKKYLQHILVFLSDPKIKQTSLRYIIDYLEGNFSFVRSVMSKEFVECWYDNWDALEEIYALSTIGYEITPYQQYLDKLEVLIQQELST